MSEFLIETHAAEQALELAGVRTEARLRITEADGAYRLWYGQEGRWLRLKVEEYRGLLAAWAMRHFSIRLEMRYGLRRFARRGQVYACIDGDKLDGVIRAMQCFALVVQELKRAS